MPTTRKRELARVLSQAEPFAHPRVDFEQYPTPPELAASIIHLADLRGDIADSLVCDFGSGPGILAIGAAFRAPRRVIGLEIDPAALDIAVQNVRTIDPPLHPEWVIGNAMDPPLQEQHAATIFMNPPFGAQQGNLHADRRFLSAAKSHASVTYSVHNVGSRAFIESFAGDTGGTVTDIVAMSMDLERQFSFHEADHTVIETELYRIEWDR